MAARSFADQVMEKFPGMRAFALRLTRSQSAAEDLVQETVLRALVHADKFQAGTNLGAWLNTILRNQYLNEVRYARRFADADIDVARPIDRPQDWHVHAQEVKTRFALLPAAHREALMLVGANGYSYEAAAQIAGCAVGTMKSRVSRARSQLQQLLECEPVAAATEAGAADSAALIAAA